LARPRCSIRRSGALRLPLDPGWRDAYQTCWSVPLADGGRLKGVMQFVFPKPYDWLPREVEILAVAAERCLLAADKARLAEQLAAGEAQIRELAGRVAQAEERERRRISSELHDEAGQSLLCVRLQLELLERTLPAGSDALRRGLAEARKLTEKTIVEIRRLIAALSPTVLDQLGLARALRQLASQVGRLHRIEIRCVLGSLAHVPKPVALAAYRLAQECLNNAARHSRASRVNISAQTAHGQLRLCVEDNGIGFRVREALATGGSFGLAGMSERVRLLGGELQVRSRPGHGAAVAITLPVRDADGQHRLGVE
jgi:signal transduction histidine kinase